LGYTIKLLGVVKQMQPESSEGRIQDRVGPVMVAVYPALVPDPHVLASVNDSFNAIFVRGDVVGDTLFYGRGAGQDPTASAVLSDLADASRDLKHKTRLRIPPFVAHARNARVLPLSEGVFRCYIRLRVADRPGVLARVAAILGRHRIGISSVIQPAEHGRDSVPLILMTHEASNKAVTRALGQIGRLAVVKAPPVMFRVESCE